MLHIYDETSVLTDLCVCRGTAVPQHSDFQSDHPEFETFQMLPWDTGRLLAQQERFYDLMAQYSVRLHFMQHSEAHPWQMYTRDTAFVIHDTLYFAPERELPERNGEIALLFDSVPQLRTENSVALEQGQIEGGDVLVDPDTVYVGMGTRTTPEAVAELAQHVDVTPIYLGPEVMHLDTRMTLLPQRHALIFPGSFQQEDLAMLSKKFTFIEVAEEEAQAMGTNVFVINPETVVVHSGFERIAQEIEAAGLKVEKIDFSEPNALLGSFRCATLPLARA